MVFSGRRDAVLVPRQAFKEDDGRTKLRLVEATDHRARRLASLSQNMRQPKQWPRQFDEVIGWWIGLGLLL